MSNVLKSKIVTEDGSAFDTRAEALDYLRTPLVKAALTKVAGGNPELAKFLFEQEDEIQAAFEVGTVSRVTKSERKKLEKALVELVAVDNNKLKFLQENHAAILESFRWPSVKRMNDAEKAAETMAKLTAISDTNAAGWVIKNKDAILAAYQAGVVKREVNPKAMEALAAARNKRTADAAAKKAAAAK